MFFPPSLLTLPSANTNTLSVKAFVFLQEFHSVGAGQGEGLRLSFFPSDEINKLLQQ